MNKQNGLSLLESLVVMVLIGIMVMVVASLSYKSKNRWDLRGVARDITANYYDLKQRASRENLPCRIKFSRNSYSTWGCIEAGGVRTWDKIKDIKFSTTDHIYINEGAGFPDIAIDSKGMLYDLIDENPVNLTLAGIKTIELRSPQKSGGTKGDKFIISFYPIGGINVKSILAKAF